jgi:uncharacterized protein
MELWTAFLLGLVGSAHCAGMCGPLALALPRTGNTRALFLAGRLAYNAGRLLTYAAIGAVFGLIGQSLALAGLQRWVSLGIGIALLIGLLASSRFATGLPVVNAVGWLKSALGRLLQRRSLGSVFALGLLNGLLPCGLVMLAFGLVGPKIQFALRLKLQRAVPFALATVAVLMILRGLALGIPYLSPALLGDGCAACH